MMMAPSCRGDVLKKMLRIRSTDISASRCTPESMKSPSFVPRSMTISAPVSSLDMVEHTSDRMLTMLATGPGTFWAEPMLRMLDGVLPIFSSASRSSGWKMMTMAMIPTW